jgi:hypothetical protein
MMKIERKISETLAIHINEDMDLGEMLDALWQDCPTSDMARDYRGFRLAEVEKSVSLGGIIMHFERYS